MPNPSRSDGLIVYFLKHNGGHVILRRIELQSVICWFTCEGLYGLVPVFDLTVKKICFI